MALVSIITPSWNVATLIGETIASVQAQTMTDWELLIADDCSTDQTAAIVENHAAQDPRVKLIRQPRNGGPALARQAAIDQAQGRFIAFLDSDDLWLPTKLEHIAEIAVYMVFLTILLAIPWILWLGYAVSTTKRSQHDE